VKQFSGTRMIAKAVSLPAPTRGINDTSPMAATEDGYCISSVNWYPGNEAMVVRSGYTEWATGINDSGGTPVIVDGLMVYNATDGSSRLFAATRVGIFDVTESTESPVNVHPLVSGHVSYTTFSNTGGSYLIAANGVDPVCMFNGSTWTSFYNGSGLGGITGISPSSLTNPTSFKKRLWFIESGTMNAYYLDFDSLGGTAHKFPLSGVFKRGGSLNDILTWSLDSGSGMDDMLVFRTTMGEIAIYQGNDPAESATFSLTSMYYVAPPIGKISAADLGGDVVMLTSAGIIPLSKVVQGVATESLYESALSRNISKTLNSIAYAHGGSGINSWEIHNLTSLQSLMIVIPSDGGTSSYQFIMNVQTGAWGMYDMPVHSAAENNGDVYFGMEDGRVCVHSIRGFSIDNVGIDGSGGTPVVAEVLTSFSYLGDPTALKSFKLVRPILQTKLDPITSVAIVTDFNITNDVVYSTPLRPSTNYGKWGISYWNATDAVWGKDSKIFTPWSGITGMGFSAALRMTVTCVVPVSFVAYEVSYERGGIV